MFYFMEMVFETTGFRKSELLNALHHACVDLVVGGIVDEGTIEEIRRLSAVYDYISGHP